MKIDLTKEEYRELLDVLFVAEWVFHAFDTGNDARTKRYDKIIQKIYAHTPEQGLESYMVFDNDMQEYCPSREFEDATEAWKFIDDFTDASFWDELIRRFTDRDIARMIGGYERMNKLSNAEFMATEAPILERYSKEFDDLGLERLEIVEAFAPPPPFRPGTHD
jgi:hypothetical protein